MTLSTREPLSARRCIAGKVNGPFLIRAIQLRLRRVAAREPFAPYPFYTEPGSAIDPLDPFVIDAFSFPVAAKRASVGNQDVASLARR